MTNFTKDNTSKKTRELQAMLVAKGITTEISGDHIVGYKLRVINNSNGVESGINCGTYRASVNTALLTVLYCGVGEYTAKSIELGGYTLEPPFTSVKEHVDFLKAALANINKISTLR